LDIVANQLFWCPNRPAVIGATNTLINSVLSN
jgi:hypothetical protein